MKIAIAKHIIMLQRPDPIEEGKVENALGADELRNVTYLVEEVVTHCRKLSC
jgi:hypothetical protein